MRVLLLFLWSALLLVVPGSGATEPVAGISGVILTPTELQTLQRKANQTDKDAIMRLGAYYLLVRNAPETASRWYSKLAATGDADGIYCYGDSRMLLNDFDTARKSLELAKQKGHPYAAGALKDLERRVAEARKNSKPTPRKQ